MFDQGPAHDPGSSLEAAEIIRIIGGNVLHVASHPIEAESASGIDITQPDPASPSKDPARRRNGENSGCAVFAIRSTGRTRLCL